MTALQATHEWHSATHLICVQGAQAALSIMVLLLAAMLLVPHVDSNKAFVAGVQGAQAALSVMVLLLAAMLFIPHVDSNKACVAGVQGAQAALSVMVLLLAAMLLIPHVDSNQAFVAVVQGAQAALSVMFFSLAYMQFLGLAECAETMQRLPVFYKQKFNLIFPGVLTFQQYCLCTVKCSSQIIFHADCPGSARQTKPCILLSPGSWSQLTLCKTARCRQRLRSFMCIHQLLCSTCVSPEHQLLHRSASWNTWCAGWAYAIPSAIIRIPITLVEVTCWSLVVYWITGLETEPGR